MKKIKYLSIAFLVFFFQIYLIYILNIFFKNENLSVAVSLFLVFFLNYFLLKKLIFRSKKKIGETFLKVLLISISFRSGEYIFFVVLNYFSQLNYLYVYIFIVSLSNIMKYIIYNKIF